MATESSANRNRSALERLITLGLVLAFLLGLVLLVARRSEPGLELILPTPTPTPQLRVYVSGAVVRPGVYNLSPGSRAEDAVFAAGGAIASADLARINLAQRLRDEQHVHVPARGETLPTATVDSRVNINTASAALLETLPGIGEARARQIVDHRPFDRIEELVEAKLVPASVFEQIKSRITVE